MVITARMANAIWTSTRIATSASTRTLKAATNPIFFEPAASRAETTVGEPSYVSGAHMWNGTSAILNANPATRNIIAIISSAVIAILGFVLKYSMMAGIFVEP